MKRITEFAVGILSTAIVLSQSGCGLLPRNWPEETKPDMEIVLAQVGEAIDQIAHVTNVEMGWSRDEFNENTVIARIRIDSEDAQVATVVANEAEQKASQIVSPLHADGELRVSVRGPFSDGSALVRPDNECYDWNSCAAKYGLPRPTPPPRIPR